MKNKDICEDFANGSFDNRVGNLFIEDNVLFSYGHHFPLAIRLTDDDGNFKFILNADKYSRTTSRHKTELLRFIKAEDVIKESETGNMIILVNSKAKTIREAITEGLDR